MNRKLFFFGQAASIAGLAAVLLSGCAPQTAPGPYANRLASARSTILANGIRYAELDSGTLARIAATEHAPLFSESFANASPVGMTIGRGDLVSVTIWEAPPATLFAGTSGMGPALANGVSLPEQIIDDAGNIAIPFVGSVPVAGRTAADVSREIRQRLVGKANQPQVIVRLIGNAATNATVVGEVERSARVPLTPHGERVLDAIAAAGGVKHPFARMTVQLTRNGVARAMPLSAIVSDPRQNIVLQPGDVVTALFQPFSFTVLGATGRNEEVPLEATGVTLSEALGRAGGLVDNRADPKGVFIFRYERATALPGSEADGGVAAVNGMVPVIYRINLKDPGSFFLAQSFQMRHKDVIYVSNSGIVDLQRFAGLVGSLVGPAATAVSIGAVLNQ